MFPSMFLLLVHSLYPVMMCTRLTPVTFGSLKVKILKSEER